MKSNHLDGFRPDIARVFVTCNLSWPCMIDIDTGAY